MTKFLANENVPAEVVEAARNAGHDLVWVHESLAGADDDTVLALSLSEGRVLVTFDKDFGEMAFRQGENATSGVVLLRPRLRSPDYLARFLTAVLAQPIVWEGHFCVAQEGKVRVIPLPRPNNGIE
jgi:predicted nuclease of predicted toxin-antitoxin system